MSKQVFKSRFLKFSVVGLSGTIVDVGSSNIFRFLFNFPEIPSITISFILAVFNNFHWNRVWTYPELKNKKTGKKFIKFIVVSVIGYIIRTPIFLLLEKPVLGILKAIFGLNFPINMILMAHNATLAMVIIIVLFWNYFANRIWTYRELLNGEKNEIKSS